MHTPEQARELWCPMVRRGSDDASTWNRGWNTDNPLARNRPDGSAQDPGQCNCIAEKCAMWRWDEPVPAQRSPQLWWPEEDFPATEPIRPVDVPADAAWIPLSGDGEAAEGGYWRELQEQVDAANARATAARRGFCGIAGRPEIA